MKLVFFFSILFPGFFLPLLIYVCFSVLEGFCPYREEFISLTYLILDLQKPSGPLLPSPKGRQSLYITHGTKWALRPGLPPPKPPSHGPFWPCWSQHVGGMVLSTDGQFNLTLALGQRSASAPALTGEEGEVGPAGEAPLQGGHFPSSITASSPCCL